MRRAAAALAAMFFLQTVAARAQDTSSWFGGTVTGAAAATGSWAGWPGTDVAEPQSLYAASTTLAGDLGIKGQRTRGEASFDLSALTGAAAARALAMAATQGGQATAGSAAVALVFGNPEVATSLRLRTLWARLDLGALSIEAGRQVINYGLGAIWSPADIFAALDLSGAAPDRLGTDALRLRVPLGDLSGMEMVATAATDPADGRYATRFFGDLAGIDGGLLAAWDGGPRRLLGAAEAKFDFGPSFYAEGLASFDPAATSPLDDAWTRVVGGLDWSAGDYLVAAEYFWNGGGTARVTALDSSFPSRQYGYVAGTWSFSDFGRLSLALTGDLEGLAESGGPWRATILLALDASQNSSVQLDVDIVRGSFSAATSKGLAVATQAALALKF